MYAALEWGIVRTLGVEADFQGRSYSCLAKGGINETRYGARSLYTTGQVSELSVLYLLSISDSHLHLHVSLVHQTISFMRELMIFLMLVLFHQQCLLNSISAVSQIEYSASQMPKKSTFSSHTAIQHSCKTEEWFWLVHAHHEVEVCTEFGLHIFNLYWFLHFISLVCILRTVLLTSDPDLNFHLDNFIK